MGWFGGVFYCPKIKFCCKSLRPCQWAPDFCRDLCLLIRPNITKPIIPNWCRPSVPSFTCRSCQLTGFLPFSLCLSSFSKNGLMLKSFSHPTWGTLVAATQRSKRTSFSYSIAFLYDSFAIIPWWMVKFITTGLPIALNEYLCGRVCLDPVKLPIRVGRVRVAKHVHILGPTF